MSPLLGLLHLSLISCSLDFWWEPQLQTQIYTSVGPSPLLHLLLTILQGTIIVVVGVIGIVAFGGINSGLSSETDVQHLTALWRRGGWLFFFLCMAVALILVFIFTSSLDAVLAARSDITSEPFSGMSARKSHVPRTTLLGMIKDKWTWWMLWVKEKLEVWTAPQDDKRIAWVLGIGWACCGGGLAGGCLVFAKATYAGSSTMFMRMLTLAQSQAAYRKFVSRKPRQSVWPFGTDIYDHFVGHNCCLADNLSQPGFEGVRFHPGRTGILWCLHRYRVRICISSRKDHSILTRAQ